MEVTQNQSAASQKWRPQADHAAQTVESGASEVFTYIHHKDAERRKHIGEDCTNLSDLVSNARTLKLGQSLPQTEHHAVRCLSLGAAYWVKLVQQQLPVA